MYPYSNYVNIMPEKQFVYYEVYQKYVSNYSENLMRYTVHLSGIAVGGQTVQGMRWWCLDNQNIGGNYRLIKSKNEF